MQTSTRHNISAAPGTRMFPTGGMRAFLLVTVLFFIWGMSNNLTDILVQQFRKSFELSALQAQLVQTAVYLGYVCMALPAALLMERRGYKYGIICGLLLFGTGTLLFWPAAVVGLYTPFLIALFFVGCGSAVLETAANPFIAQFGSPETSEQRLNFSQSFNPPGTIAGVLLGAYFIFSGVELTPAQTALMKVHGTYTSYLHTEIMRVVPVYIGLGCLVLFWAFLIGRTTFPAMAVEGATGIQKRATFADLKQSRALWYAVAAQFFYCGAQVSTWSSLIPYLKQYSTLTERTSALWLTGSLVIFAIGRFIATGLMRWIKPMSIMLLYSVLNVALLIFSFVHPGQAGAVAILITSFFMAPMFATIFARGVRGLGPATKLGGSFIVMAVVGAAAVPPILGLVAKQSSSYARGYLVPACCYVLVAAYAILDRDPAAKNV
jgi:FHS family L-fucose permease-like MFS transporter